MRKAQVKIGEVYEVRVSGRLTRVRLDAPHPIGGWVGTNLATGRQIRLKTAARLRGLA